jgi:uncharacterized protein YtpQ (UPF0354 family)
MASRVLMTRTFEVRCTDERWEELSDRQIEAVIEYMDDEFTKVEGVLHDAVGDKGIYLVVREEN